MIEKLKLLKGIFQFKDLIALAVLIYCLYLIGKGVNHLVSGITIMIVSYYFTKRADFHQKLT